MPPSAIIAIPLLALAVLLVSLIVYRRTGSLVGALFTALLAAAIAYGVFIFLITVGQPSNMDLDKPSGS